MNILSRIFGKKKKDIDDFSLLKQQDNSIQDDAIKDDDYFLSLGAGGNQIPLITAAQELGYKVIAVDRDHTAPGFAQADFQIYADLYFPKKIINTLKKNLITDTQISSVGCRSFGRTNYALALISKYLSLPGPKLKNLWPYRNKAALKELMISLNIPTAQSYILRAENLEKYQKTFSWENYLPLIARPIVGHAKKGVRILYSQKDVDKFLFSIKKEKKLNKKQTYILDEYIEAREVIVMGFVIDGKFSLLSTTMKRLNKNSASVLELQHLYLSNIEKSMEEKFCEYIQSICSATHLENVPFVAEFLISGEYLEDPKIYMIECAPETGGEYLADYLLPAVFNRNYFQDLVKLYAKRVSEIDIKNYSQPQYHASICFIPQKEGCLKKIEFPAYLKKENNFLFSRYLKKPGEITSLRNGNKDRLAVFGLKAPLDDEYFCKKIESIVSDTTVEYES